MSPLHDISPDSPGVVIWGASGHASVVADIVRLDRKHKLLAFVDTVGLHDRDTSFLGYDVLTSEEDLKQLPENTYVVPGFGDCRKRFDLVSVVQRIGLQMTSVIHPSAVIAEDCTLGAGTVVAANAVINPGARIGECVIVNTSATVDHGTRVGRGAHICPGVNLAGDVEIGEGAWIGIGSTVLEKISIGGWSVIGAGSVVNGHIPDRVLAYGVPAYVKENL